MSKPTPPSPARWNAVAVVGSSSCCEAARALKGQRFLSAQAPRLPLANCSDPTACRCVYRKYTDRREGPRREDEVTGLRRSAPQPERRRKRGRRTTDQD